MALRNGTPSKHTSTAANPGRYDAVVWLDSRQARVTYVSTDAYEERTVRRLDPPRQLHIEASGATQGRAADEPEFYHDLVKACDEAKAVLLIGPSWQKRIS